MRRNRRASITAAALASITLFATAYAQVGRGGSEWLTARGDAQCTSWIRTDPDISVQSMSKPGFDLQWKTKLDNANRQTYAISQGVSAPGVTLFVPMSLVTGSSNNVFAIDSDTGWVVWQRHFDAPLPPATASCPGGTPTAATRIVSVMPPPIALAAQGASGRGAPGYRSLLGEPDQGAPVELRGGGMGRAGGPPAPGRGSTSASGGRAAAGARASGAAARGADQRAGNPPAAGRVGARGGRGPSEPPVPGAPADQFGGGGYGRPSGVVYAISSDGVLHVMGLMSGKDLQRPAPFVPANSQWSDPIAVNTTMYTSTSSACGTTPNAVWAIDLASDAKPVVSWKSGGPIVGAIAFTTDGTLVVAVGPASASGSGSTSEAKANAIVALDAKTLQVKGWFSAPGIEFATGPTIFKHGNQEIIAAATKDGRVLLLDAASPGGPNHSTPLATASLGAAVAADALATWQELTITPAAPATTSTTAPGAGAPPFAPAPPTPPHVTLGTRWILAPVSGSIVALKVGETGGRPTLEKGWTANVAVPATPIIVNGVVFAVDTGRQGAAGAGDAILRAYAGASGKEFWNSGKSMTAAASPGSFWSAFGQVYVGTTDDTLYAFGFNDERR